jgi:hypothetical protein
MSDTHSLVPGHLKPNAPGLRQISYRSGKYGTFREAMLKAIGREGRYLVDLNTRASDDPTVALIDAWAVAGDVLSFYAERIANETYVGTATERLSIRALARLLDYELGPGKAAETWLAFTLEDADGAPLDVPLPKNLKVNSIPGPDENMVAFETIEEFTAHPWLNAMRPQMEREQRIDDVSESKAVLALGNRSDISQGDTLLVFEEGGPQVKLVVEVDTETSATATNVIFKAKEIAPVGLIEFDLVAPVLIATVSYGITASFVNTIVSTPTAMQRTTVLQRIVEADLQRRRVHPIFLRSHLARRALPEDAEGSGVYRLTERAAAFGHNKPPSNPPPSTPKMRTLSKALDSGGEHLFLDREYPDLIPGGYAVVDVIGRDPVVLKIKGVASLTKEEGTLVSRVTRLTFEDALTGFDDEELRNVTILFGSEEVELAPLPVTVDLSGSTLRLDSYYPDLAKGRFVAVEGERADLEGVNDTSVHEIAEVSLIDGLTELELKSPLPYPLKRDSVALNGNMVRATHGESGGQPIGHGDASKAGQSFALPITPLTHVGAPTEEGIAPELSIHVDHVEWSRVKSLRSAGPLDRVYSLSYREDGTVIVRFGDGIKGRRLPTGTNNVVASWRKGLGSEGMLKAGQLSLLADKPQGVRTVLNPVPPAGAADPASMDEARENMIVPVLTLGKVVTLRDYADFARGFASIEKAHAAWVWDGPSKAVFLTVAGVDGALVEQSDMDNLRAVLAEVSDRSARVTIVPHRDSWFRIEAGVHLISGYSDEKVFPAIEAGLRDHFGFKRREFGQHVARSEVLAVMQGIEGVEWVDLDALWRGETKMLANVLTAGLPRSGRRVREIGNPLGAELLALDPAPLDLKVIS